MNDTNAFVLPHSYDIDPSGFNTFYSENHLSLVGINRMEFIQLCTLTLQKILKDNSISKINFHQMSIVCACYSSVMNYQIIPTESIQSKIKFIIRNWRLLKINKEMFWTYYTMTQETNYSTLFENVDLS